MISPDYALGMFVSKFIINIFDSAFYFFVAIILFNLRPNIKRLILPSVIMGFIFAANVVSSVFIETSVLTVAIFLFLPLISTTLITKFTLNINIQKSFLSTVIATVIQNTTALVLPYIGELLNIDFNELYVNPYFLFLVNLINLILNLPFLILLKRIRNFRIKKRYFSLIALIILINFTVVIMNGIFIDIYIFKYGLKRELSLFLISMAIVLTSIITTIIISLKISKLSAKEQELESQIFYNDILMKTINDLRRVKHNRSNVVSSIYGLIKTGKLDELEKFMDELVSQESKLYSTELLSLTNIKNGAILGILNAKLEKAREHDVKLDITVNDEINEINMPLSQFCEVLGILLDNAIEAAADSTEKFAKVTISSEGKNISFKIENSCKEKPDIAKMYQKDWTTKGEGRGLGLWIVNNIKRKNKNLILNTIVDDNLVQQELVVG